MKKILISASIIAAVAAVVVGGTIAYFSDTETSTGNTISAGALDLTLNQTNGGTASAAVTIADMKPSQTWYSGPITLEVFNNPGKLYKHIVDNIVCDTGNSRTEPECGAEGGQWNGTSCTDGTEKNYLPEVTWFDLEVWVGPGAVPGEGQPQPICEDLDDTDCWKTIIPDGMVTVDDIASHWIYLGEYGEQLETNKVIIRQSFHMKAEAGNEYQGDTCSFAEEFQVLQTNAPHPTDTIATLELDNKTANWGRINDNRIGYMTYNPTGSTFDYDFVGQGLNAGTGYCLIYYSDPWPGTNGFDLSCGTTDGSGSISLSGNPNIGSIPVVSDANYPNGAKIWLVTQSDYDTVNNKMTAWHQAEYLYEANLITYTK